MDRAIIRKAIARCIREQRRCLQHIREHGTPIPSDKWYSAASDAERAWFGWRDWKIEEAILRGALHA